MRSSWKGQQPVALRRHHTTPHPGLTVRCSSTSPASDASTPPSCCCGCEGECRAEAEASPPPSPPSLPPERGACGRRAAFRSPYPPSSAASCSASPPSVAVIAADARVARAALLSASALRRRSLCLLSLMRQERRSPNWVGGKGGRGHHAGGTLPGPGRFAAEKGAP